MTVLNEIMNEEQVTEVSEKVLASVSKKVKDQIADALYSELEGYLYEHYTNFRDRINEKMIDEITEEFVKNPQEYKYEKLRKKIWDENKNEVVKNITDLEIEDSIENIIFQYTHRDYSFGWKWEEGLAKIILKNWKELEDNEGIKNSFRNKIKHQERKIGSLKLRLKELEEELEKFEKSEA